MAGSIENNIYIPFCGKKECESRLQAIADFVKNCTTRHEMYGSYAQWFEKHFKVHHFTIIHYCPYLWRKVRSFFHGKMEEMGSKLILLNLEFADIEENAARENQSDLESLSNFFTDFGAEHIVSDDQQLLSFGNDVLKCVRRHLGYEEEEGYGQSDGQSSGYHSSNTVPQNTYSEYSEPGYPDMPEFESDDFKKYPDIFGQTDHQNVFIKNCHICDSGPDVKIYDPEKGSTTGENIATLNKGLSPQEVMSNNKFILLKILPEIYADKDLPALASVCMCKNTLLQKRALVLLELCVWEGIKDNPDRERKYLVNAESMLDIVLKDLKDLYLSTQDVVYLALLERASNIYYMIISAIIMCSKCNKEAEQICDSYLDTIRSRSFDSLPKSKSKNNKLVECLNKRNQFVAASKDFLMVKNKTASVLQKVTDEETDASKCARGLSSKPLLVQVVVAFEMLKKLFEPDQDLNSLQFLREYLAAQKGIKIMKKEPEAICIVMVFRALTLFLKYHLLHFSHRNNEDLCSFIIDVLYVASHRELPPEVGRSLHSLIFHPTAKIRDGVFKILDEREKYKSTHFQYSMNEIRQMLDPLLQVHGKSQKDVILFTASNWKTLLCTFGNESVVLCFHVMNEKAYRQDTRTALENHKDINYNEMNQLINLQHKNIIQLLAYQRSPVLPFYITDDCSQNLQTVMQNYRNSGKYFTHLELCHFLLDATTALQYCHDKNLIHRNLTAQCLTFSQKMSVKLCSCGLCVELGQSQKVIDLENHEKIPFRWSAPESLFLNEYTKASDIWMVGVLIYEVMTHGVLPFWKLSDKDLGVKMKSRSARLNSERCLDDNMTQLIFDCTAYDSESRPYIENVITRIEEIIQEFTQKPRTVDLYPYPKFEKENIIPSTCFNRGLPFHLRETAFGDTYQKLHDKHIISDILVRMKLNNGPLVFREKIVHSMPPAMLSLLQAESIKPILRQMIKLFQSKDSVQYLVMSIPPSDCLLSNILDGKFDSLETVLEIIYQVAVILSKIASMDLILGDLYPSAIYVDKQNYRNVYIMSLAFMKKPMLYHDYQVYNENRPDIPEFMIPRAAPEVIQESNFSSKTDVYCFGSFIWQTLSALDTNDYANSSWPLFNNVPTHEIKSAVLKDEWDDHNPRPKRCPDKIYQLIKSCVSSLKTERPTMSHVVIKLKEYYKELFGVILEEFVPAAEGVSYSRSNSQLSTLTSLSECNPSTVSDGGTSDFDESDWGSIFSSLEEINPSISMYSSLEEINPSICSNTTFDTSATDPDDYTCGTHIKYFDIDYAGAIKEGSDGTTTTISVNSKKGDSFQYEEIYDESVDAASKEDEEPKDNEYCDDADIYESIYDDPANQSPEIPQTTCPPKPAVPPKPTSLKEHFRRHSKKK